MSRLSLTLERTAETALRSSRQAIRLCIIHDPRSCHLLLTLPHWRNTTACSRRTERIKDLLLRLVSTSPPLDLQAGAQARSLVIDPARGVFEPHPISCLFSSHFSFICFSLFNYGYQEFKQARRNLLRPFVDAISFFITSFCFLQNHCGSIILYSWAFKSEAKRIFGKWAKRQGITMVDTNMMMMQMTRWKGESLEGTNEDCDERAYVE
jgi:hypothetical protein